MQEDVRAALASVASEWDKAESLMKLAEKVRTEVVLPSVNELRYAGRRLVDAWSVADAAATDPEKRREFDGYVKDALFRCHCAQHDAVDACVLFVEKALNEYEAEFGLGPLTQHFPDVADLRLSLAEAGDLIVSSRGNRGKRAADYDKLAADHLPTITLTYRKIQTNRPALEAMIAAANSGNSAESSRFRWGIIWPVIFALVAAGFGYVTGQNRQPVGEGVSASEALAAPSSPRSLDDAPAKGSTGSPLPAAQASVPE